ncbi:MerR family transcriptional regulator [Antarcticirhabdus aurantiaca]|uniref:MerR family transcriptional regulator n=1 Tax=Antarcticirhabdus aurantiaca TaxID=2606717 RepID=A0ACD4NRS3_9HYPH|nr:MerR family transcriptional regulator [Antarcticirhabdus aurantiaca]WAJ29529.1 MerR family transcriptional regulator [Jeongeuplla avenae]
MRIGELAKRTGLTPSRIRFYESAGLLGPVERRPNGYRSYSAEAEALLLVVTSAQQAGFSLDEVRHLLPTGSQGWQHEGLVAAMKRKVEEIAALEQQLAQRKAQLVAVIDGIENRPDGLDCADNAKRVLALLRT